MALRYTETTENFADRFNPGSYYPRWDVQDKIAVNQALNMIDPESPAGRVLNGLDTTRQLFLSNIVIHEGTDTANRLHWNFTLRLLGSGGTQSPECHLYEDGTYTIIAGGEEIRYGGNPMGRVAETAKEEQKVPTDDDFPPLG